MDRLLGITSGRPAVATGKSWSITGSRYCFNGYRPIVPSRPALCVFAPRSRPARDPAHETISRDGCRSAVLAVAAWLPACGAGGRAGTGWEPGQPSWSRSGPPAAAGGFGVGVTPQCFGEAPPVSAAASATPAAPAGGGRGQGGGRGGPPPVPINFNNQTLREIVHTSLGGDRVRVVLSNAFGTSPLTVGAAHVALREKDAMIVAKSDRPLAFGGSPSVNIPPGSTVVSDPVVLTVPASIGHRLVSSGRYRGRRRRSHARRRSRPVTCRRPAIKLAPRIRRGRLRRPRAFRRVRRRAGTGRRCHIRHSITDVTDPRRTPTIDGRTTCREGCRHRRSI